MKRLRFYGDVPRIACRSFPVYSRCMGTTAPYRKRHSDMFRSRAQLVAALTIAASIAQGLLAQSGAFPLLFSPPRTVFAFEVWRPFTALFVAMSPVEVIFGALIIYSIGGTLESRWGGKRFLATTLGIPLIVEAILMVFALLNPFIASSAFYPASRSVITALWILFGLSAQFAHETLNFWGTPVRGKTFALIGVGFVVLSAVFSGIMPVLPDLLTVALCYVYMYRHRAFRLKNKLELSYYDWKLKKLRGRANLRVIKGSRADVHTSEDEDKGPQIH